MEQVQSDGDREGMAVDTVPNIELEEDDRVETEHERVEFDWRSLVSGLRSDAARAVGGEERSQLLTVAGGLTWQLLGDFTDAHHLLAEAVAASSELWGPHRERVLLRLRSGEPLEIVFADLSSALIPATQDALVKARGRSALLGAAVGRAEEPDADLWTELEELAQQSLTGTLLPQLWTTFESGLTRPQDLGSAYFAAMEHCHTPVLKAAMAADLASGTIAGHYTLDPSQGLPTPFALFLTAARSQPDNRLYEALAISSTSSLAEQLEIVELVAQRRPSAGLHLRAGQLAWHLKRFDRVEQHLREALRGEGDDRTIAACLAWRSIQSLPPDQTQEAVLAVLDIDAEGPQEKAVLALELASHAARAGDLQQAAERLTAVQSLDPALGPASGGAQLLHAAEGNFRAWVESERQPRIRAALFESRLRSPTEALDAYEDALKRDPNDSFALLGIVRICLAIGQVDRLIEVVEGLRSDLDEPNKRRVFGLVFQLATLNPDLDEVTRRIGKEMIAFSPNDPMHIRQLAEVLYRVGNVSESAELIQQALGSESRQDTKRLLTLDIVTTESHAINVDELGQWVAQFPESPFLLSALERSCIAADEPEQLLAALDISDAFPPRDTKLLEAECLLLTGSVERAFWVLSEWLSEHPEDRAARDMFGRACRRTGRLEPLRELRPPLQIADADPRLEPTFERWWAAGFDFASSEALASTLKSSADRRVVWATSVLTQEHELKFKSAQNLLSCAPTSICLQALAEESAIKSATPEDRLQLYLAWAKSGDDTDRDYLLHKLAQCYLELDRPSDALVVWTKLVQIRPDFLPALAGKATAMMQTDRVEAAIDLLAGLESDFGYRPADTPELQFRSLVPLLEDAYTNGNALLPLECASLAAQLGWWDQAIDVTSMAVTLAPKSFAVARSFIRAGARSAKSGAISHLRDDTLLFGAFLSVENNPEAAATAFRAAARHPEAIAGLLAIGTSSADPYLLYEALQTWNGVSQDYAMLLHLDLRAAELAEFACRDLEHAAECYERALRRLPGNGWIASQFVRTTLNVATFSAGRWRELRDLLGRQADACEGLLTLATVTGAPEQAAVLSDILDLDSTYLPAEWALLRTTNHAMPLEAAVFRARRRRSPLLMTKAARAHLEYDEDAVAESLCYEAIGFESTDEMVAMGGPLALLGDRWAASGRAVELLASTEDLIARVQTRAVRERLLELILRVATGPAKSASVTRHALNELVSTRNHDWGLLRLATVAASSAGDWNRVLALLALAVESSSDTPALKAALEWERAEVQRTKMDDSAAAKASLSALALQYPEEPMLHISLDWENAEQADWEPIVDRRLDQLEDHYDPETAPQFELEVAWLYEFPLGDTSRALEHYQAALLAEPESLAAAWGVTRAAAAVDKPAKEQAAIQGLLPKLNGRLLVAATLRAAELSEFVQGNPDFALQAAGELSEYSGSCLDTLLRFSAAPEGRLVRATEGLDPSIQQNARVLLESAEQDGYQPDSAVLAARIFRPDRVPGDVARMCQELAEAAQDARLGSDLLRMGLLSQLRSGEDPGVETLKTLVAYSPSDLLAPLLIEAFSVPGDAAEREAIDLRLRAAPDGLNRADALAQLVRHAAILEDDDLLWATLEQLRELMPQVVDRYRSALASLDGGAQNAAQRLENEASRTSSPARRSELLLRAAKLRRERTGELEQAIADLGELLKANPKNTEAFDELQDIYVAHGDAQGLFDLLEHRHPHVETEQERLDILERMAKLAFARLGNKDRAVWCHQAIVATDPSRIPSYRILAEIYADQGKDIEVARMLEEVVQRTEQSSLAQRTHLQLGSVYSKKLDSPDKALSHYREALAFHDDDLTALSGAIENAERLELWDEAAKWLRKLAEVAPVNPRSAVIHIRLARALRQLDDCDVDEVETALRTGVTLAPNNKAAVEELAAFARTTGRSRVVESIVTRITDGMGLNSGSADEGIALRALFDLFSASEKPSRAYVASAVLKHLGYHTSKTEMTRTAWPDPPGGWRTLTTVPVEDTACVFPLGLKGELVELLRIVDPFFARLFPSRAKEFGASRRNKVSKGISHPATQLAKFLSRPDTDVHLCLDSNALPSAQPGSVPQLLLPHDFPAAQCGDSDLWRTGFALAPTVMGFGTISRVPRAIWLDLVTIVIRLHRPDFLASDPGLGADQQVAEQVRAVIPRKTQRGLAQVSEQLATMTLTDLNRQHSLLRVAFACLASLACSRIEAVLSSAHGEGGAPLARGIIPFLLKPEYAVLRESIRGIE